MNNWKSVKNKDICKRLIKSAREAKTLSFINLSYHEDDNEVCCLGHNHTQAIFDALKCSIQQGKPNADDEFG